MNCVYFVLPQVRGFSDLLRNLRGYDSYFACGDEVNDLNESGSPIGGYFDQPPSTRKSKHNKYSRESDGAPTKPCKLLSKCIFIYFFIYLNNVKFFLVLVY